MRRVPSCLFFAALVLSPWIVTSEPALAQPGVRHGLAVHHVPSSRHKASARDHRIGPRYGVADRVGRRHHVKGFRNHRYGFHGHGFFPHRSWYGPYVEPPFDPTTFEPAEAPPPHPVLTGIPSVADLPVSAGIRSAPAASPTLYVLDGRRSPRRGSGGAKIVTMDQTESEIELPASGPRIIHLDVPRGRR